MSVVQTVLPINFAAPTALLTDTVSTDGVAGATVTSYTPRSDNYIVDIRHAGGDPAAGILYNLFTRRSDLRRKLLGNTGNFLTTVQKRAQQFDPGLLLLAGFVQFVEQQTLGALTAQNYIVTLQQPLNV